MNRHALYFITGASGAGKTTLLKGVAERVYPNLRVHHFDEDHIIPSIEEMKVQAEDPAEWQAYHTRRWVEKITQSEPAGLIVFDAQARPAVLFDMVNDIGFSAIHIVLIDCAHAERRRRLLEDRAQPELDTMDMYIWAGYLRGQADALRLEVIDTTAKSLTEAIQALASSIGRFADENGIAL